MKDVLIHHGIRGQKWGVRRFENADGTLTNAGKKRYHEDSNGNYVKLSRKERKINAYTEKYTKMGMTEKTARIEAEKTVKRNRNIKIAAAAAGVAAGAYLAKKYYDRNVDKTYKNVSYQHITLNKDVGFKDGLYVADNEHDKKRYSLYVKQLTNQAGIDKSIYEHHFKANNIKVAGHKSGKKALEEMYNNMTQDEQKRLRSYIQETWKVPLVKNGKITNIGYEAFNGALVDHETPGHSSVISKYYNTLKSKGFDGIQDINDEKYSGYNTKAKIIFNKAKLVEDEIKEKNYFDYTTDMYNERGKALFERNVKVLTPLMSATVGLATVDYVSSDNSRKKTVARNEIVSEYKKEHPETTLSDAKILKMIY